MGKERRKIIIRFVRFSSERSGKPEVRNRISLFSKAKSSRNVNKKIGFERFCTSKAWVTPGRLTQVLNT